MFQKETALARALSIALVFTLTTSFGFFMFDRSDWIGSADPRLIPNGNYTSTVVWEFADPGNYTTNNIDLSNQEAKLTVNNLTWGQTSESDFRNGTLDNTVATVDGKLKLSDLTKNAIANGNFSTDTDWIYQNSPNGNVSSQYSSVDQNSLLTHDNNQGISSFYERVTVDQATGDGSTVPGGLLANESLLNVDSQWYHLDSSASEYILVQGFDPGLVPEGEIGRVVLWATYRVDSVEYDSQTSVMIKNETGVFRRTDIVPMDGETGEISKSFDITHFHSTWSNTTISTLEVRFQNVDNPPYAYVEFNSIWLDVFIEPIDESGSVHQNFTRPGNVGYHDTGRFDFNAALNKTNIDITSDEGNVTLSAESGIRETTTLVQSVFTGKDTHIIAGSDSKTNYGSEPNLMMLSPSGSSSEKRILMQFNLSSIPSDSRVESSYLWLRMGTNLGPGWDISFYRLTTPWTELNATWEDPWTTFGGDFNWTSLLATTHVRYSNGNDIWMGWDLTDAVRDWGTGNHTKSYDNFGIIGIIDNTTLLIDKQFHSSETAMPQYCPQLVVTYSNLTYASSGYMISRAYDAGQNVVWKNIRWNETTTPGTTSITVQTRTGSTDDPYNFPGTWEGWMPTSNYSNQDGEIIVSSPGRYLQYKVEFFTSHQNHTPILSEIQVRWAEVKLAFDYYMEGLVNIDRATLHAHIDDEEVWSLDTGIMGGWSSTEIDIGDYLVDDLDHTVRLGLTLFSNNIGPSNATARFDNVRITNPLMGEYLSPVFSPGFSMNWKSISWNQTLPPGTSSEIMTRVGDTPVPDGSWTPWSPPYSISTGESISHRASSHIQYKVILSTTDSFLTPELEDVSIEYSSYATWGMVQANEFSSPDMIEWGVFNTSASMQPGNDIKYYYSTNNGTIWQEMSPGFNMSSVAIPDIRVKAELSTLSNVTSPLLYHMNLTYIHLEPLDRIDMSISTWSGTADDVVDLDATGRDRYDKVVAFQQFWSTTDPKGTVNVNGLYNPGSAGTWRVYCNNSDDTISNFTTVTVGTGQMVSIGITPWQVGTITTNNNVAFSAYGVDGDGNLIAQAIVNWSLTSGIGVIGPGPSSMTNLTPTTPGTARVIADDGMGNVNVTSPITVIPGASVDIAVTPYDPGSLTTDDTFLFTACGKDKHGNTIGSVSVNWSVIGGIGVIPPGPSESALFDPTTVGNGRIVADDGLGHVNSTATFSVSAGQVAGVQITPSYAEVGIGEEQNFTVQGFDSDGNRASLVTTIWTTDVGNIVQATATSATLQAQSTPKLGGWVNATHGSGTGSATVDVVEYQLSPVIQGTVPSQERPEDYGSWSLDLSGFASDPNEGLGTLMWNVKDYDSSLYTVSGTSIAGNHILVFTTVQDAYGSDQPTLELINSLGFKDVQPIWINITPVNDYPVFSSSPDLFVRYDEQYVFDYSPYITDIDNDASDFSLITDDLTNTTVNGLNVTFSYPQSMVGQTAYVRITVMDGAGGSDSDLISVRVSANYPPTLVKLLPDIVINEGETLEGVFDLDDYIVDPDADSLFYSFGYAHLTIEIDGDHVVDITAMDQWTGFENVTFRAVDPIGGIAEDTIMVQVIGVNDPPEISNVPPFVIHYDFPFTFDLFPYITDVDNDLDELTVWTNNPSNVTVNGMVITLLYPEIWGGSPYPYTVPLTLFVSDGTDSSFLVVTVSVTDNFPPSVLKKLPDLTFDEDFQIEYAFDLDEYFMDADNDTLFFVSGQETIVVTIDVNHSVTIAAPLNWFGTEYVTFRAIDLYGGLVEDTIQVDVRPINDAPEIAPIPNQYVVYREWTLDLTNYLSDVDNDISELNVSVDSQYVYADSMILFFGYPEGVDRDNITITVSDGVSNTTTYVLVVIKDNEPTDWLSSNWLLLVILLTGIVMAIGSGGYLLFKKPMIIEDLFLIHRNGMLIEHHTRRLKITVDHDILSGMLTAILEFTRETFTYGEGGGLKKMDLGERKIFLDRGEYVTVAIVVRGEEPEDMSEEVSKLILDVEERYPEIEDWDGTVGAFKGLPEMLGAFVKGTYEKGFWRTGPKRIKTLLDERQKGNSNNKSKKNGRKNGKKGKRNGKNGSQPNPEEIEEN